MGIWGFPFCWGRHWIQFWSGRACQWSDSNLQWLRTCLLVPWEITSAHVTGDIWAHLYGAPTCTQKPLHLLSKTSLGFISNFVATLPSTDQCHAKDASWREATCHTQCQTFQQPAAHILFNPCVERHQLPAHTFSLFHWIWQFWWCSHPGSFPSPGRQEHLWLEVEGWQSPESQVKPHPLLPAGPSVAWHSQSLVLAAKKQGK